MPKITDFMTKAEKQDKAPVQGYVPTQLRTDVIEQMKLDRASGIKTTWDVLLEACLKVYLEERSKNVPKAKAR